MEYRKYLEYIQSKNARKINKKIKKLKDKNLINEELISDTFHTFESLYFQRCILFAAICNQNKNIAWKSKKHEDGSMFDNYFIVGINTDEGSYTYHYHMMYWEYFKIKELENAPKWDGHTDKDVIRLLSLKEFNPLRGIFAGVTDDELLIDNGNMYSELKEAKERINKVLDLIDNHNKLEQELGGTIKFNIVKVENILRGDKK